MKTYSIWNNDLGDRQIWVNDETSCSWSYSSEEYDAYLRMCRLLEREGYKPSWLEAAE